MIGWLRIYIQYNYCVSEGNRGQGKEARCMVACKTGRIAGMGGLILIG